MWSFRILFRILKVFQNFVSELKMGWCFRNFVVSSFRTRFKNFKTWLKVSKFVSERLIRVMFQNFRKNVSEFKTGWCFGKPRSWPPSLMSIVDWWIFNYPARILIIFCLQRLHRMTYLSQPRFDIYVEFFVPHRTREGHSVRDGPSCLAQLSNCLDKWGLLNTPWYWRAIFLTEADMSYTFGVLIFSFACHKS